MSAARPTTAAALRLALACLPLTCAVAATPASAWALATDLYDGTAPAACANAAVSPERCSDLAIDMATDFATTGEAMDGPMHSVSDLFSWMPALRTGAGQAYAWTRAAVRSTEPRLLTAPAALGGWINLPVQPGMTLHAEAGWTKPLLLGDIGGVGLRSSDDRQDLLAQTTTRTRLAQPWMQVGVRWQLPKREDLVVANFGVRRDAPTGEFRLTYRRSF